MDKRKDEYFRNFGYKCFGPILYNFSIWLNEEINREGITKLYFLSRDGYIIKRAFDKFDFKGIDTYYLYASRRSIIVPSLWKLDNSLEIFDTMFFNKKITLSSFIKKVGLEDCDINMFLERYSYNKDDCFKLNNMKHNRKFINFLDDIFPMIKENSKNEWNDMMKYLRNNNFADNVAIIDIGWFGSMQKAFLKVFENINIYGFYMGLVPQKSVQDVGHLKGYLFDMNHHNILYDKFHNFISIFEFIFLAQHGSVKKFVNGEHIVELYDYEYDNTTEKEISQAIQFGALKYVDDAINLQLKYHDNIDDVIKRFLKVMLYPSNVDAEMWGDILFEDDKKIYIAKPKRLIYYLFHIRDFKNDFAESNWKIGFLKRLLKIRLPYYFIIEKSRKIFIKNKKVKD